jgi:CTP:molybdopterin cytidylyltransferase MocA
MEVGLHVHRQPTLVGDDDEVLRRQVSAAAEDEGKQREYAVAMTRRAVILAAGGSQRMGRPKALLELDGRPIVAWHCEQLATIADEVVVVTGAAPLASVVPTTVRIVHNAAWATTEPRHSLLLAIAGLDPEAEIIATPVDVPPAPANVLEALLAAPADVVADRGAVVTYDDTPGHPVRMGARSLQAGLSTGTLRDATARAVRVPVDWPDALRTWNNADEWSAFVASVKSAR